MGKLNDIRAAVEDDLTFDPDIDGWGITVGEQDGEVTLSGSVPSYPKYVQAAAVARRVPGVRTVRNQLEVVLPLGGYRDDQTLTAMANDVLTPNHAVPVSAEAVQAIAKSGVVTLTGMVRSDTERAAAELRVVGLTGVRGVTNDIQVRDEADPAGPG